MANVLHDLVLAGPSSELTIALIRASRGGAKLKRVAIELAAGTGTELPFEPLLELAAKKHDPSDGEALGRALAIHTTDLAMAAMFDVFHTIAPKDFWSSGAAIGHALRMTPHPKATHRLLELAKHANAGQLVMIVWTLARRPRDGQVAAFAEKLYHSKPVLGAFLMLGHSDDAKLTPLFEHMLEGKLALGGAISDRDTNPLMIHAEDFAIASRVDAISAFFTTTVIAALAGNAAARTRLEQVQQWLVRGVLPPSAGWMPALATLIATADEELATIGIEIFALLALPAHDAEIVITAILTRARHGQLLPALTMLMTKLRIDAAIPIAVAALGSDDPQSADFAITALLERPIDLGAVKAALATCKHVHPDVESRVDALREKVAAYKPLADAKVTPNVLGQAANELDLALVHRAIALHRDVNADVGDSVRPLHLALEDWPRKPFHQLEPVVEALIAAGADPLARIEQKIMGEADWGDDEAPIRFRAGVTPVVQVLDELEHDARTSVMLGLLGVDPTKARLDWLASLIV